MLPQEKCLAMALLSGWGLEFIWMTLIYSSKLGQYRHSQLDDLSVSYLYDH